MERLVILCWWWVCGFMRTSLLGVNLGNFYVLSISMCVQLQRILMIALIPDFRSLLSLLMFSVLKTCLVFLLFTYIILNLFFFFYCPLPFSFFLKGSITRHDIDSPPTSERVVSIYKYEDIFMPSAAYQTFSSPFCLLLIVALTFYLLMGTP